MRFRGPGRGCKHHGDHGIGIGGRAALRVASLQPGPVGLEAVVMRAYLEARPTVVMALAGAFALAAGLYYRFV